MKEREGAKALGAYYTDVPVADFLVEWAIRSASDSVLDPSFGGGVFLLAACRRLTDLGGNPAALVFGVELDPTVHERVAEVLWAQYRLPGGHLIRSDFFDLDGATASGPIDVLVGNPPFIRYQRFAGEVRRRALNRAAQRGVRLSELSSSWAPFLIHGIGQLRRGGRLAMVVPVEIGHAAYARPVLEHLENSFRKVTFLTFRKKLFPNLNEDTLLLLAEDKGAPAATFEWRDLPHAGSLSDLRYPSISPLPGTRTIDARALSRGRERLIEYFIPETARGLYRRLLGQSLTRRLGELADVGIGYVTGANDYFHLNPDEARRWEIPESNLRPAVRRGRALRGLRFTATDWRAGLDTRDAGYLLMIDTAADLPDGVRHYLEIGERKGIPRAYKCRVRSPWFRVPHVHRPDAFLSYMSGVMPRLVANDAGAVAPNSLHMVRLHPGTAQTRDNVAALWQSSLTRLSVEIEGHALGGGMLKLEPTEAERVVVPVPLVGEDIREGLAEELDALTRRGRDEEALARADAAILKRGLGLSEGECSLLRSAAETLRSRRYGRSATA